MSVFDISVMGPSDSVMTILKLIPAIVIICYTVFQLAVQPVLAA
jgi:hypothetical protein